MKRLFFSLFLIFIGVDAIAQQAWQVYNTQNSGLPDNDVFQIAIDGNGTKWIATNGGLAKFDGTTWTTYTTADGLPDNSVRCVAVAPNNTVWVGTFTGGMAMYNGSTFTTYNSTNSNLPDNFVRNLAFEGDTIVWATTGGGLAKVQNNAVTAYDLSQLGLFSNSLASIAVQPGGVKVIGMINGGFAYYNDTTFIVYTHDNSSLPDNTVLSVSLDGQGNPYMAMPDGGIIAHFGGNIWQLYNTTLIPAMTTSSFKSVAKDPQDAGFWAGSFEHGLIRYNGGASWQTFTTANSGIPDDHLQGICPENDAIIWVGTSGGGLARFDRTVGIAENTIDNSVTTYFSAETNEVVISSDAKLLSAQVYGIDGRLVAQANNSNATKITLPVSANGLVVVHCVTAKGVAVKKLMAD